MPRFNEQQLAQITSQPGYTVGHAAFVPVAPGLSHPVAKLYAWQKPLDLDAAEEGSAARIIVRITRYGTKLLDKDNLYGGAKPICDALRYEKLIPEDDPESIELYVCQKKVKRKDVGTYIEILTKK